MASPALPRLATDTALIPSDYPQSFNGKPDPAGATAYDLLLDLPYPLASATTVNGTLLITEPSLGLDKVAALVSAQSPKLVVIYADVLTIADSAPFSLADGALVIVARRVENVANTPGIIIDSATQNCGVYLFTQSCRANLTFTCGGTLDITPTGRSVGRGVQMVKGVGTAMDLTRFDLPGNGYSTAAYRMMLALLVYATSWWQSHPATARETFAFVEALSSGANNPLNSLHALASAFGTQLVHETRNSLPYVPPFSDAHYKDKILAYLDTLGADESDLAAYLSGKVKADSFAAQARDALGKAKDQSTIATDRLAIARSNYQQTYEGLNRISADYTRWSDDSQQKLTVLQTAVADYQMRAENKEVFNILAAVASFAMAVSPAISVLTEAPSDAEKAAQMALKIKKITYNIKSKADDLAATKARWEKIKKAVGDIKITDAFSAASDLYNHSLTCAWAADILPPLYASASAPTSPQNTATIGALTFPKIDPGLLDASWDEFEADFTASMDPYDTMASDNTLADASFHKALADYKASIAKMIACAKAASAAMLATIFDGQKLAMAAMLEDVAARELAQAEHILAEQQTSTANLAQLVDLARTRILRHRLQITLLQHDYREAYTYYSGVEAKPELPVLAAAADFQSLIPGFFDDAEVAFTAHSDKKSISVLTLHITNAATDPLAGILQDLITTKTALLKITLDTEPFSQFRMIRISEIRARIDGIAIRNQSQADNVAIVLEMTPGSVFKDGPDASNMPKSYRGNAPCLTYNYQIDAQDINTDNTATYEDKCPQIKPSACTDWSIRIIDKANEIDMSKVSSLRLFFYGTHYLAAATALQTR